LSSFLLTDSRKEEKIVTSGRKIKLGFSFRLLNGCEMQHEPWRRVCQLFSSKAKKNDDNDASKIGKK
jgi:hypothetical protein